MTATVDEVLQQIGTFVRKRFDIEADDPDFNNDAHLFDLGYVDSFGAQELINFVETTYGISIEDDDLIKYPMNTLNEISKFVIKRKANA